MPTAAAAAAAVAAAVAVPAAPRPRRPTRRAGLSNPNPDPDPNPNLNPNPKPKPNPNPNQASGSVARASSELFVLDPITLSWSQVARTPPLRREAGTLVGLGDKFLLAFGGWSGHYSPVDARLQPWSDALHALHLPTRRWFQLAAPGPAPVGRYGHAAAIIDTAPTHAAHCTLRGEGLRGAIAVRPRLKP